MKLESTDNRVDGARQWVGRAGLCVVLLLGGTSAGCIPGGDTPPPPPDDTRALLSSIELTTNVPPPALPPPLSPAFDPKVTSYSVTVPNSATAVTIKAVLADSQRATLKINNQTVPTGQTYLVDNLKVGPPLPVVLLVEETGPGGITRSYTLSITRAASPLADLASLTASAGGLSPPFDPQVTAYTVRAGNSTTSTTITAAPLESTASLSINGQSVPSGQPFGPVSLAVGSNTFTVTVSPPGGTPKQYSVVVIRGESGVADLAVLQVSAGVLSPAFAPDVLAYSVATENATTQTTVTALPADSSARLTINGQAVPNGQPSAPIPLVIGDTTITIVVTAQDGSARTYTVRIRRPQSSNNNLSSLSVSAGSFSPAFAPGTTSYSLTVLSTVASTTVTAAVQDSTATLTINGTAAQSGQTFGPVPLNVGANQITIVVTAQDGTAKTYVVTITRNVNPNLANLTLSAGPLSPAFAEGTTSYTVSAPNATDSTTVTATVADSTSTLTINGQAVTSGQAFGPVPLIVGPNNTFTIVVTAAGGVATKSYTVTVTRAASANANLSSLQVSPGAIAPAFDPAVTGYSVTGVGLFTPSVSVVATVQDPTATLTINGQAVTSGQALSVPVVLGTTPIPVTVSAQDAVTVKTYTVTVTRP